MSEIKAQLKLGNGNTLFISNENIKSEDGSKQIKATEVSVSATGTSADKVNYITIDGTEKKLGGTEVSVSATGTATDEVKYITIDGTEKKIGGGVSDFDQLTNRPKYNGTVMSSTTNIPEVKTSAWDAKQNALTAGTNITISGNTINATAPTNMVTTDSIQTISAAKKFSANLDLDYGKKLEFLTPAGSAGGTFSLSSTNGIEVGSSGKLSIMAGIVGAGLTLASTGITLKNSDLSANTFEVTNVGKIKAASLTNGTTTRAITEVLAGASFLDTTDILRTYLTNKDYNGDVISDPTTYVSGLTCANTKFTLDSATISVGVTEYIIIQDPSNTTNNRYIIKGSDLGKFFEIGATINVKAGTTAYNSRSYQGMMTFAKVASGGGTQLYRHLLTVNSIDYMGIVSTRSTAYTAWSQISNDFNNYYIGSGDAVLYFIYRDSMQSLQGRVLYMSGTSINYINAGSIVTKTLSSSFTDTVTAL